MSLKTICADFLSDTSRLLGILWYSYVLLNPSALVDDGLPSIEAPFLSLRKTRNYLQIVTEAQGARTKLRDLQPAAQSASLQHPGPWKTTMSYGKRRLYQKKIYIYIYARQPELFSSTSAWPEVEGTTVWLGNTTKSAPFLWNCAKGFRIRLHIFIVERISSDTFMPPVCERTCCWDKHHLNTKPTKPGLTSDAHGQVFSMGSCPFSFLFFAEDMVGSPTIFQWWNCRSTWATALVLLP